jgi:hypothetical protein
MGECPTKSVPVPWQWDYEGLQVELTSTPRSANSSPAGTADPASSSGPRHKNRFAGKPIVPQLKKRDTGTETPMRTSGLARLYECIRDAESPPNEYANGRE